MADDDWRWSYGGYGGEEDDLQMLFNPWYKCWGSVENWGIFILCEIFLALYIVKQNNISTNHNVSQSLGIMVAIMIVHE